MPPRKPVADQTPASKKTTLDRGGDAELSRREREAADRSVVAARGIRLQKLDAEGAPVGEPVDLGDAAMSVRGAENLQVAPVPVSNMEFETSDPAAIATVRELTRIPIPTAVVNMWWPAFFRPPNEPQPWNLCKAFLTPQGLYVYRTAPEAETYDTGALPAWWSPVDFAKTARPVTGYAAQNAGIPITTAAGRVNVQPSPGCGCTAGRLKRWTPTWARNRISWEDAVKLAATDDATAGR